MINALRRFYRRNFYSAAKAELFDSFQRHSELRKVVIMDEVAPLGGIRVRYVWQQFPQRCVLFVREYNFREKTERTLVERNISNEDFIRLMELVNSGLVLGNLPNQAKDGVLYTLSGGHPSKVFTLSIGNPKSGSEHENFVKAMKTLALGEPPNIRN